MDNMGRKRPQKAEENGLKTHANLMSNKEQKFDISGCGALNENGHHGLIDLKS